MLKDLLGVHGKKMEYLLTPRIWESFTAMNTADALCLDPKSKLLSVKNLTCCHFYYFWKLYSESLTIDSLIINNNFKLDINKENWIYEILQKAVLLKRINYNIFLFFEWIWKKSSKSSSTQ